MPTPEQRFEVPPEYAEVYERAYRRAYEEGQGQLSGGLPEAGPPLVRGGNRGRRIGVPRQRSQRRGVPQQRGAARVIPPLQRSSPDRSGPQRLAGRVGPGRRAKRRAIGSTVLPLAGLVALGVLLLVGAFLLGQAGARIAHQAPLEGTGPGATASATAGPSGPASSTAATPTAPASSGPYDGAVAPVRVIGVRASCQAKPGRDSSGHRLSYAASNVVDGKPATAWRCDGRAIGERLVFRFPPNTEIVRMGLVPGYAKTDGGADLYARNNRITRVAWVFDNGTRVTQSIGAGAKDRSFRVRRISEVPTRTVTLVVLAVKRGPGDHTMISTVRFAAAAPGSS